MSNERDELRGTLSNTICNASFYPPRAQPYLLGGDMSDVLERTADALVAAGYSKPRTVTTEWQSRAPEDAGIERGWMGNLEGGAIYLQREHGYEARTRTVSDWVTYSPEPTK